MSSMLPDLVDPWRAVEMQASFTGRLQSAQMPRLAEQVVGVKGDGVEFAIEFGRDAEGRPVALGSIKGSLVLRCQRCLEVVDHEIDVEIALVLVSGLDEAEQLPERYDPLLITERLVRPIDLVEDEILLGLPLIPMHAPGACRAAVRGSGDEEALQTEEEARPFDVLAQWRAKK